MSHSRKPEKPETNEFIINFENEKNPFIDSPEWKEFEKWFFDDSYNTMYLIWHDGFDVSSLTNLSDEKKIWAKKRLLEALVDNNYDYRVIEGLAVLCSKDVLPALKELRNTSSGDTLVSVNKAIVSIGGQKPEDVEILYKLYISILKSPLSDSERLKAAMALKDFNFPAVIAALLTGVQDDYYLVRYHCANSLLFLSGYKKEISEFENIFSLIIIMNDIEEKYPNPDRIFHPLEEAIIQYKKAAEMLELMYQK